MIVITQNDIAPDYETISKYDPKCGKTPVEYYDEKLPPILDQCIRNIFEVRKITSELQKNTSWEKVMVEKIVNSVNGQGKFDEFTKNDIDDVIKMFQWLDEHGIKYTERHIVEKNPTYDELKVWYQQSGLPIKKFFNTSGLVYKEMQLKDKLTLMSEEEQLMLLATHGMLVKRPMMITHDIVLVGFKEADWEGALL